MGERIIHLAVFISARFSIYLSIYLSSESCELVGVALRVYKLRDDPTDGDGSSGVHCGTCSRRRNTSRSTARDNSARGARGASTSSASTSSTATNNSGGHADAISRS